MRQKYFLKLSDVRGESENPRHPGAIEIAGFAWGGDRSEKSSTKDLTVFKQTDNTTPVLWGACHTGLSFSEAVLTIEEISGPRRLRRSVIFKLKSVLLGFVTTNGDMDSIGLNFASVQMTKS